MGGEVSKELSAPQQELLSRLSGPEAVGTNDPFWNRLFKGIPPLPGKSPAKVEVLLAPSIRQLRELGWGTFSRRAVLQAASIFWE